MRRPLKPFVTEYKGTRRQAQGSQSLQPPSQPASESSSRTSEFRAFESERSRPKPFDAAGREDMEDSYEAAMRAADALFARPTSQPAQRPVAVTSEAAAERPDAVASSSVAPDRGGRILRALDEPPAPQLVALEAAHAPKRRGRKPGSKNKPKIAPTDIEPVAVAATDLADAPSPDGPFADGLSEDAAPLAAQAANAGTLAAKRKLEAIPLAQTSPHGSPSNVSKRFSWVRDRLKPGENWKRRRLPRICW